MPFVAFSAAEVASYAQMLPQSHTCANRLDPSLIPALLSPDPSLISATIPGCLPNYDADPNPNPNPIPNQVRQHPRAAQLLRGAARAARAARGGARQAYPYPYPYPYPSP